VTSAAELFRQSTDEYAERGIDALAEIWDPHLVYEEDPLWPGTGTYHGRDAVVARFREYEEQIGRGESTIERIVERPDGVVVIFRYTGVTPGAGVPFEHLWAWVVQMRDGKATHIRAYVDPDEPLRVTEP
jgi:ketosteroid isomerase-like protein